MNFIKILQPTHSNVVNIWILIYLEMDELYISRLHWYIKLLSSFVPCFICFALFLYIYANSHFLY